MKPSRFFVLGIALIAASQGSLGQPDFRLTVDHINKQAFGARASAFVDFGWFATAPLSFSCLRSPADQAFRVSANPILFVAPFVGFLTLSSDEPADPLGSLGMILAVLPQMLTNFRFTVPVVESRIAISPRLSTDLYVGPRRDYLLLYSEASLSVDFELDPMVGEFRYVKPFARGFFSDARPYASISLSVILAKGKRYEDDD